MNYHRTIYPIWVALLSAALAADPAPIIDSKARFHPQLARAGMVVSQERLASEIGAAILGQGGNAIDAAVATGFALAVTLPRAGNIGGGGFMLVYLAEERRTVAIDYREMAPRGAYPEMFQDSAGNVDNQRARYSIDATAVPGTVAGLLYALERYGSMSRAAVLAPAIALAEQGIEVSVDLSESLQARAQRLLQDPASAGYFYRADGSAPAVGSLLVQRDLAATLRRIAEQGEAGFYRGETARLLLATIAAYGGSMDAEDLANYRVAERTPLCGSFRDSRVCAMSPPSSGGVHLIQMLNILENWDLRSLGHNSAAYLHRLVESMRRAYADRSRYLGDPDFYPVPVLALTDKGYAAKLASQIDLQAATDSEDIAPALEFSESLETTHYSSWDRWGNVVSNTYTLNFSYGNGKSVAGGGFLLNNEMDDFSAKRGAANGFGLLGEEANQIEPHKRPLSSMTPAIVFDSAGQPSLATGSPGGSTIITVVLQTVLNSIEFAMNAAEATAAPRIHHQWWPNKVLWESGISLDTRALLAAMGHQLEPQPRVLGATQSIAKRGEWLAGAADYRRSAAAAVGLPLRLESDRQSHGSPLQ